MISAGASRRASSLDVYLIGVQEDDIAKSSRSMISFKASPENKQKDGDDQWRRDRSETYPCQRLGGL